MVDDSYTGVENRRHLMNEVSLIVSPCAWTLSWSVEILLKCLTLNSATMANLYFGQQLTIIFTGCIWRGEGQFVPSFQIFCFRTISDPLDHAMNL
jgi:hypothetical protein